MKYLVFFIYLLSCTAMANGAALDGPAIIKMVEDNLNGETAFMRLTMTVKTKRTERTVKMESYSIGKEKSFIKITYPHKDKGVTFLKVDQAMWEYVPRIERIIKIPASMMLQSWMGSDFTNDDLVRESSITEDYDAKLFAETDTEYEIELIPRENAPVVWGKLRMLIDKQVLLPLRVRYFDETGQGVRVLSYRELKRFGERMYPTLWVMENETAEKAGNQTIITMEEAVFDQPVDEKYFTKRALKQFSD